MYSFAFGIYGNVRMERSIILGQISALDGLWAVSETQLRSEEWESRQFNFRLQPTQIALGTVQNGTDKLKLD